MVSQRKRKRHKTEEKLVTRRYKVCAMGESGVIIIECCREWMTMWWKQPDKCLGRREKNRTKQM